MEVYEEFAFCILRPRYVSFFNILVPGASLLRWWSIMNSLGNPSVAPLAVIKVPKPQNYHRKVLDMMLPYPVSLRALTTVES